MAKAKRKPGAPEFAVMPKRRGAKVVRDEVRMARLRTILARTASSRAELDARMAGADTADIDHLPVVEFPRGVPKLPGLRGRLPSEIEDEEDFDPDEMPPKPPMAPPVPFVAELERKAGILNPGGTRKPIACSACGSEAHRCDSRQCPKHPSHVMAPVKLETIEADADVPPETFHQPLPPNTGLRYCKACGRPRCRVDSRFCPKNPNYIAEVAAERVVETRQIVLDDDLAEKLERAAELNKLTVDDLLLKMLPPSSRNRPSLTAEGELTDRQRECVDLFNSGLSYRAIGARLNIAKSGVKAHLWAARQRDPSCTVKRGPNIPAPSESVTSAPAPVSVETSTPIEQKAPKIIPGSAFFNPDGESTSIVVYASRELLEAFRVFASRRHPDADFPSELVLRKYMVSVAWGPREGYAIRKPRGPYKCSACGVIGHRADSRKCPRSVSQTETTAASASA